MALNEIAQTTTATRDILVIGAVGLIAYFAWDWWNNQGGNNILAPIYYNPWTNPLPDTGFGGGDGGLFDTGTGGFGGGGAGGR